MLGTRIECVKTKYKGNSNGFEDSVTAKITSLKSIQRDPMTQPRMTFVIPVLNDEEHIGRCLGSIDNLQGSKQDYEVLVLDNGSTDETQSIILRLGFPFQVVPQVHVSSLRNLGAAEAKGEYLAFVDSDVELTPPVASTFHGCPW